MILVDTSVWVDHFRRGDERLADLLENAQVILHPLVIGELALGNLNPRKLILCMLEDLPRAVVASDSEIPELIDRDALFGTGIGYIDAHLIASARLTPDVLIWSRDNILSQVASRRALAAPQRLSSR